MKQHITNSKLHRASHKQRGFTLIELMLALSFLAFILIFIVSAMVQYMNTYNKGLVYKEINQAGRTTFEDINRSLRFSSANVSLMSKGRLCMGGETYVWNTPTVTNKYEGTVGNVEEGMIRVPDGAGALCIADTMGNGPLIPKLPESDVIAGSNVEVQSFAGTQYDNGGLYKLKLVLSTGGDNRPDNNLGDIECPGGSEGQFCAVAEFETFIAARR